MKKEKLLDAIQKFGNANGYVVEEKDGKIVIFIPDIPEGAEPPTFWVDGNAVKSSGWSADVVREGIMNMEPATKTRAVAVRNSPKPERGEDAVKDWLGKADRSYTVDGGRSVPNALSAAEVAANRGYSIAVDGGRSNVVVWAKVRATDPKTGAYREARVSFDWETFRAKATWEIARTMERKVPGIVTGIAPDTMLPIFGDGLMYHGQPAALYLHLQVLNRWTFADRDAESKAMRRAVLALASKEWRDPEEVEAEMEEERDVNG